MVRLRCEKKMCENVRDIVERAGSRGNFLERGLGGRKDFEKDSGS